MNGKKDGVQARTSTRRIYCTHTKKGDDVGAVAFPSEFEKKNEKERKWRGNSMKKCIAVQNPLCLQYQQMFHSKYVTVRNTDRRWLNM